MFGESVQLTYNKKRTYQTWIGTCVTFLIAMLFISFLGVRTNKLVSATDPFFSMMTMAKEESEPIDLWARNYMFAIEDIDPRAGYIYADHIAWGPGKDKAKTVKLYEDKDINKIEMVDCLSLLEDPDYESFHISTKLLIETVKNTKAGEDYLCPVDLESLNIRGHWGTRYFEFVGIEVMGCRLGSECFDDQEVINNSLDFISMRAHPSLLADDKS